MHTVNKVGTPEETLIWKTTVPGQISLSIIAYVNKKGNSCMLSAILFDTTEWCVTLYNKLGLDLIDL